MVRLVQIHLRRAETSFFLRSVVVRLWSRKARKSDVLRRAHRRAFHNLFNIESVRRFLPQEKKATNMFLRRILHASTRDLRRELRL